LAGGGATAFKCRLRFADRRGVSALRRCVGALTAALAASALAAPVASGSEHFADHNVRRPTLKVDASGRALVEYTTERGLRRHVLVWGAVNANHAVAGGQQVRFKYDFTGGLASQKRSVWRRFKNACRAYDGPALAYLVAACKAPDGSYWALQTWQRRLPLLGFTPWLDVQDNWELHVSHWHGELPVLEAYVNWTYGFMWQGVFGRLTYQGRPVHGFLSTNEGNPRDRFSRNVYIDTLNSSYGPGWKRESGILTHKNTGAFCHSFVPQRPFPGYPNGDMRPSASGERYRLSVMGPGVMPVLTWEGAGLPRYDAANPDHVRLEAEANATFDRVMAGDRICSNER
jgi:hypothetical protein